MIKLNSLVWVDELGPAWVESCPVDSPHWRVRLANTEQSMVVPRGDIAEPGEDMRNAAREYVQLTWRATRDGYMDGQGNFMRVDTAEA